MHELLYKEIIKHVELTENEFEKIKYFFIPKKLRRRQYLLQEGDPCKYMAFVNKGCLRSYILDTKGQEVVIKFSIENEWIADLDSFATGKASMFHIDALEDTELLLIDRKNWIELFDLSREFERYIRLSLEENSIAQQYRTLANISLPADERYSCFASNNPAIVQRVPQHMIASYLGMTAETLSRIRK
jgi:CRP-like cAMP-binding protein